jgi:hypothetical protein
MIGCMYAALAPGRGVTRWCRWEAPVGGGCPVSAVVRVVSCGVSGSGEVGGCARC